MPGKVVLEVTHGPMKGKDFTFEEHDTFIFGRARDCHARLSQDDTTASRHHFLLEVNPPDVRIRDLGSLNGTYVNGKKQGGRSEGETPQEAAQRKFPELNLKDRDKIVVGETTFLVRIRIPYFCCRCRKEIPEEFKDICRWIEGTYICPQCKKLVESGTGTTLPEPVRCDQCGKDVSEEVGSGRIGDYICESCQGGARFDPVGVLVHLLMHQQSQGMEEATLSDFAGYGIDRMLGRGTMGATYLAHRKEDAKVVALKILIAQVAVDEKSRKRFHQEVDRICELRHAHITELLDHGSAGTGFYFAMEYCPGGSVQDLVHQRGKLSLHEAGDILLQCVDALRIAHVHGFVHRNLKPENILLSGVLHSEAHVADFGLANSFERNGLSGMTATALTSPQFVPREQLTHFRFSNPVSDVWSLAAIFYYMVTGTSPRDFHKDKDPIEVILRGELLPIRERDPGIPKKLARVIDRALSDHLEDRFPSASEFSTALRKVL